MAGVVPQRARTAGLKREEGPVCVMGRAFRRCKPQPLHPIDQPRPRVPQASHGRHKRAADISRRSPAKADVPQRLLVVRT